MPVCTRIFAVGVKLGIMMDGIKQAKKSYSNYH